jgi:manganese-dependent inorganic pyrophosphatase
MFAAGEDLTGRDAEDVFFADFKKFSQGETDFGVGQGSYMSPENLAAARKLLQGYIREARTRTGLDMIFYMLTDIQEETSILLYDGEGAEELVGEAFERETTGGAAVLPGVISRKKQLVPALVNTLRRI